MKKSPEIFISKQNSLFAKDEQALKKYDASQLDRSSGLIVDISTNETTHTIEGFGAALSGTSCYHLNCMTPEQRDDALESLFSEDKGIGLNITRQAIGVTDFAHEYYTYDDMPDGETDFELKNFSIDKDREYIIPQIKKAQEINPDLIVCGSVWSPPVWMKTIPVWDTKEGSALREDCHEVYCQYYIKALQAYEAEGIHFNFITPQNEPFGKHGIPACYYDKDMMGNLVNNYLAPAFKKAGVTTKIFGYDFNLWTNTTLEYIATHLDNIEGIAMHYYGTEFKAVKNVHDAHPDLPFYITECGSPYERHYENIMDPILATVGDICSALRYGANAYIRWNYVLDQNGAGSDPLNRNFVCEGILVYDTDTKTVRKGSGYYGIQHFSQYIRPGAEVLVSTDLNEDESRKYYAFAAKNKDGSTVAVLANCTDEKQIYKTVYGDSVLECELEPKSVATIVM